MTAKITTLTVQKWGNSLAVRIPAPLARKVHFYIGTLVEMEIHDDTLLVKSTGKQKLTLEERLKMFDPQKHGGEIMASKPIGKEKF